MALLACFFKPLPRITNTWSHWHAPEFVFVRFRVSKASRTRCKHLNGVIVEECCLIETIIGVWDFVSCINPFHEDRPHSPSTPTKKTRTCPSFFMRCMATSYWGLLCSFRIPIWSHRGEISRHRIQSAVLRLHSFPCELLRDHGWRVLNIIII